MDMGKDVLSIFHPIISEWFERNIGEPSLPQVEGWPVISRGENVLIAAPTGAGKTLSAFMECINNLFIQGLEGRIGSGVQVLYVSPLKALNNDIYRNLEVPLSGISKICEEKGIQLPGITMGIRTGDTPQADRRRMIKNPPHILITTPESLYLLLTAAGTRDMLKAIRYLIIDEIHTLLGNKRGAHLAISVERLSNLTGREFARIGLSATVKPVEEAAKYLGGFRRAGGEWVPRPVTIIEPSMGKMVDLKITMPVKDFRVLEEGTIWPEIYKEILSEVNNHKSTLVFVNGRATAEKVAANLNNLSGKTIARAHHGCISRESRLEVEKQLKAGELPCLVATSSMELGIDVGAIDLMLQVASPKSVARGLQRLGRAGHRLNAVSKGRIIPRTQGDLLETAIVSREMLNGSIEEEHVPKNSLDVLAQQLVAMACVKDWTFNELMTLLRSTYSYQTLKEDELDRVLCMLAGDYERNEEKQMSPRLIWDRVNRIIRGNNYSRMLAVGGSGTIPDRGYYGVYLSDGKTRLGELDETFVYEARIGERFMLGTSAWRIEEIRRDRVVVSQSGSMGAKTPFWTGEGLGRPYQLGRTYGSFLDELSKKAGTGGYLQWIMSNTPVDEVGAKNLENYVLEQKAALGCLPGQNRIIVEYFSDEVGDCRIVVHSSFGGRVNAGLKILLEHYLSGALHSQVESSHNDDGILINILGYHEYPKNIFSLVSPDNVEDVLIETLPETPLFAITFRYNAARALMMGQKRYGRRTQLWAQRIRALEVMQVAEKNADHPLIVETFRECMEMVLDVPSLIKVLKDIKSGKIQIIEKATSHPSPFTRELLFNFMGVMMYEGQIPNPQKPSGRIVSQRSSLNLNFKDLSSLPDVTASDIHEAALRGSPYMGDRGIKSYDELHNFLLTYGDIVMSEEYLSVAREKCAGSFEEWIASLESEGRISYIELPGSLKRFCVASEEYSMYIKAMRKHGNTGDGVLEWTEEEALSRIIRRYARYCSPFQYKDLLDRYPFIHDKADKILKRLEEDEVIIKGSFKDTGEVWCHASVLDKARKIHMAAARDSVVAKDGAVFASFLPSWQKVGREPVSPVDELYDSIQKLRGLYLPAEWWEEFVFPARIKGYKKAYLDRLCSSGRVVWRVKEDSSSPKLSWYTAEGLKEMDREPFDLNEKEKIIYGILKKKGASFLYALSAASSMDTGELLDILESLVWKGIVTNDSFEPVRYFLSSKPSGAKQRAKIRASAYRIDMGRWEITGGMQEESLEENLHMLLNRYGLISREVILCEKADFTWNEAYEVLKQWEYTGRVNRGYFIKGISGIQFMLPEAAAALNVVDGCYYVLDACDPAQAYGRILHYAGDGWTCVSGNALVIKSGEPVIIVEGYGERFLPVSHCREDVIGGMKVFAEAFSKCEIWPGRKRIKMKQWGEQNASKCEFSEELDILGFNKEMQDLVLWR